MKQNLAVIFSLTAVLTAGAINHVYSAEADRVAAAKNDAVKVEEVFAKKDALNGKKITVKGEVVKFNSSIMGKNWVHIKDGSGKPGTNDLTATTNDTANVGDKVVVTGTLAVGKDFGAGYKYEAIMEEATITPLK
ncbi:MAG: hypothetical protein U0940_02765 [Nitrospirota bacterium]|nr:hypothetical protein [Nitrospirota bacterium]